MSAPAVPRRFEVAYARDAALYAVLVASGPMTPTDLMRAGKDPREQQGAWTIARRWLALGLAVKVPGSSMIRPLRAAYPDAAEVARLWAAAGLSRAQRAQADVARAAKPAVVPAKPAKPTRRPRALAPWLRDAVA